MPLSADDGSRLIRNLLAIDDLPARVERSILAKAEGNPFFVEEVTRSLIDAGAVARDPKSGRWRATAAIGAIQIPDTVQGVIIARIDRLDEEVRQVLRVASVVGRSFLYRLLQAVSDVGMGLDDDLAALQRGDLIRERSHLPELEYMFKHPSPRRRRTRASSSSDGGSCMPASGGRSNRCSPIGWRSSTDCSPTTMPARRRGTRPRSTCSRRPIRQATWRLTPRRWPCTSAR